MATITENKLDILPPTPNISDEEIEEEDKILKEKSIKLQRRGTVSLADLIPIATAAHKAKHRTSILYNDGNSNNSALARALTKVKVGLQTHKLKEKYLTNEWIRLALSLPINESVINSNKTHSHYRTKEIVKWYEHKHKRSCLTLTELETRVDSLRNQKLTFIQQQQLQLIEELEENSHLSPVVLPLSPPL